jgi:hypothetical protein
MKNRDCRIPPAHDPKNPTPPIPFGYMGISLTSAARALARGVPADVVRAACGYGGPRAKKEGDE